LENYLGAAQAFEFLRWTKEGAKFGEANRDLKNTGHEGV
jgi:hypothetical protein